MQTSSWWKTWRELNTLSSGRRVVFWGRSDEWLPKTLKKLRVKPDYIVDINSGFHGSTYKNIEVSPPSRLLKEEKKNVYIVITAGSYQSIVSELIDKGFEPGRNFCCCPEYRDYHILEEIRSYRRQVIVSCPDYLDSSKARYSPAGGGLYRYVTGENSCERLVAGQFRQIEEFGSYYYVVEYIARKLCIFHKDFTLADEFPLDAPDYCGLTIDRKRNSIIMVNATYDTISIHSLDDFSLIEKINFSRKSGAGSSEAGSHHLNDCCVHDDTLFVSYFSWSGNWKRGQYDGGVCEYQLSDLSQPAVQVVSGLWCPHSPNIIEGDLCYLDSMRSRLHISNQTAAGSFDGFMRGLTYDGNFYFIGQSEDMYISRIFSIRKNIMLNSGFFMFDPTTKASRFFPMFNNMNVHDLHIPSSEFEAI